MSKVNCKDCSQADCAYFGMNNKTNCKDFVLKAQPSQQWVGLTDEERTEIRREHYARTLPLMKAVEAKLKEKNT